MSESTTNNKEMNPWFRVLIAFILMSAVLGIVYFLYAYWSTNKNSQSTDNAYVKGDLSYITSKVSGYVEKVNVQDNQFVKAGQNIAEIDRTDYQSNVDQVRAKIEEVKASQYELEEKIKLSKQQVLISQSEITAAKATQLRASNDVRRNQALVEMGGVSKSEYDRVVEDRINQSSNVDISIAKKKEAEQAIRVLEAQRQSLVAALNSAEANLKQAQNNLKATILTAPTDGTVVSRKVRIGEYVSSGKNLVVIAPSQNLWIEANLKETQLSKLEVGDQVIFSIDAIPHHEFCGRIDSIAKSSGSELALLPADNATGNFTKIVRRFPVKISFDAKQKGLEKVAVGMSSIVQLKANTRNLNCRLTD